jgi:hypothetical protein
VVVLVLDGLQIPLTMATATGFHRENGGLGEIQIRERKGELQRGRRVRRSTMTATFTVYLSSGDDPRAQQPREGDGVIGFILWVERRGVGRKMASRGRLGLFQWVLYPGGELRVRGLERWRLGSWAVRSGWYCGLRLRVWSVVSVAYRFGRKQVGFSVHA